MDKVDNVDNVFSYYSALLNSAKITVLACFKLTRGWHNMDNVYLSIFDELLKLENVDNVVKTSILACFKLTRGWHNVDDVY